MITTKRVKIKGHYRIIQRDEKGRIVSSKKWHSHKALKCELCGDLATTWTCFGDGTPKRVCQGCSDSIDRFMGHKCDMACIKKKDKGMFPAECNQIKDPEDKNVVIRKRERP